MDRPGTTPRSHRRAIPRVAPCALGLSTLCLAACLSGPHRLLVVHSPDRRHRVAVVESDGRSALEIDGRRGETFEAIVANSLTFDSAGRHVAHAIADGDRQRLAHDHCAGAAFDGLGEIVFSPDGERLAYTALAGGRWHVVIDGEVGAAVDGVFARTLRFDPSGARVAYVAEVEGGARVFVDRAAGPRVDAVSALHLPREGGVGYVARRGASSFVVRGDELGPAHARVGALWVGKDGHTAYAAWQRRRWLLIHDGAALATSAALPELAGSDDGQHVAWLARDDAGVVVWLDRAPLLGPFARVRPRSLGFGPGHASPSFVAERADGRQRAVVAGAEQPALDRLGALVFSADGRHWAYAGRRDARHVLIVDGIERTLREPIGDPVLSAAGDRIAFVPLAAPARAVVDGREFAFPLLLPDTLAFARDGRHWAVVAGSSSERRLYFAIDGSAGPSFDFAELISSIGGADAAGSPLPGTLLRDWARVTADAAAAQPTTTGEPWARWLSGRCQPDARRATNP